MRRWLVALCCLVLLVGVGAGCSKKKKKKGKKQEEIVAVSPKNVKDFVNIEVDDDGFHPDRIPAQKGRPITLIFTRTDEDTCATHVVISEENIRKELPVDKPVTIPILPGRTGNIHFSCPAGKFGGEIQVQ